MWPDYDRISLVQPLRFPERSLNIEAGILAVTNDNAVGGVVLFNGGDLQLNNYSSAVQLGAQSVTLGAAAGAPSTLAGGFVSGGGSLNYVGPGTLILTGNNSYTGSTTLSGGELSVAAASALGSGSLVFSGGTLQITGAALATLSNVTGTNFNGGFDIANSANIFTVNANLTGDYALAAPLSTHRA